MKYTVQKLALLAGISTRTLHHYDEIGLLRPVRIEENRYRLYSEVDVLMLQQILFFRELGFTLEKIKKIITSPNFETLDALQDQKRWLTIQKERYEKLITTVDVTIQNLKGGEYMSDDMKFNGLSTKQIEEYQKEAEERWGDTDVWKQSQERTKHFTKADYEHIGKQQNDLAVRIANAYKKGLKPENTEVQLLINEHYEGLKHFYEPTYELYKGLGQMYVDDKRFTAFYDKYAVGLAHFMRDAMHFYADDRLK